MVSRDSKLFEILLKDFVVWAIDGYDKLDEEKLKGYAFDIVEIKDRKNFPEIALEKLLSNYLPDYVKSKPGAVVCFVSKDLRFGMYYVNQQKQEFSDIDKEGLK